MLGNFGAPKKFYIKQEDLVGFSPEDLLILGWEFFTVHQRILKGNPFVCHFHRKNLWFIRKLFDSNGVEYKITLANIKKTIGKMLEENLVGHGNLVIEESSGPDSAPDGDDWVPRVEVLSIPDEVAFMKNRDKQDRGFEEGG